MKATKFFNDLYAKHYNDVLNYCIMKVTNFHTAEDLTQNTFMKIANNTGETLGYNPAKGASIKTWVLNYAKNTVYDYYRTEKESRYSFIGNSVNEEGKEIFAISDNDNVNEQKKEVRSMIRTSPALNENDRKIALLYWVMGLRTKEVAEVLEIPLGTVNVTMKRIKTKLAPVYC